MSWLLLLALMPATAQAQPGLWAIEKVIALKYPVQEIRSDSLAIHIAENDSTLLLFDTRKPEEYAVSRLRDAIRIDPEMDAETFFATYGDTLKDTNLVFYCSVGYPTEKKKTPPLPPTPPSPICAAASSAGTTRIAPSFGIRRSTRSTPTTNTGGVS
jgi:hypothetical protein